MIKLILYLVQFAVTITGIDHRNASQLQKPVIDREIINCGDYNTFKEV